MTYAEKLLELDRHLKGKLPMAPITTRRPTPAEVALKDALNRDVRNHARRVADAVGVYPA